MTRALPSLLPSEPGDTIVEPPHLRSSSRDAEYLIQPDSSNGFQLIRLGTSREPLYVGPNPWHEFALNHFVPGTVPVIGVLDHAPRINMSDTNFWGDGMWHGLGNGQFADIGMSVVALSDHARIEGGVSWANSWGNVSALSLYGLDIVAGDGANSCVGGRGVCLVFRIINCAYLPHHSRDWIKWGCHTGVIAGDLHIAQGRRETHNGAPVRFQEHRDYIKYTHDFWYVGNDIAGGNRTGMQKRANTSEPGPVLYGGPFEHLIRGNWADEPGMDWDLGFIGAGGACITHWGNPYGLTVIEDNAIRLARYGGIYVTMAPDSYLNARGHAYERVIVRNNAVTQHRERTDHRTPVSFGGGIQSLEIEGNLKVHRTLTQWDVAINDAWPAIVSAAPPNGRNHVHDRALDGMTVGTWDYLAGGMRAVTPEEIRRISV